MNIVQSLWIEGHLSRLKRLCIQSWLRHGYAYHLYTYSDVAGIPVGVQTMDARKILPESMIFRYHPDLGGGSYAGFSNFFRFKLLLMLGGIWVDTDLMCLKELPESDCLCAWEYDLVASCLLKLPHEVASYCWEACQMKDIDKLVWGETGPHLVTQAIRCFDLQSIVRHQEDYFPIMYDEIDRFFKVESIPHSFTVHFWNEMWSRRGLDKNATRNPSILYERLMAETQKRFN